MRHYRVTHLVLCLLLALSAGRPGDFAAAQGGDCPALVQTALEAVDQSCGGLGRDEACYGHVRVDASFRQPRDPGDFDAPADRVPVADVQAITTAPLDPGSGVWGVAVLSLRADLPETMPGQAVTFLLMGSAALENAVAPGDTTAGPMQAFYFTTGLDAPLCSEAPNALIVRTPQGAAVSLRINDLDVQIGSTVMFTLANVGGVPVMVVALLEGHLAANVNGQPVDLQASGGQTGAIGITLNAAGRVDASSVVVPAPDSATATVQSVCSGIAPAACAACTAAADQTVNLRGGPGTTYEVTGQLAAGEVVAVVGRGLDAGGAEWWQVTGGGWVRADLVSTSGDCGPSASAGSGPLEGGAGRVHRFSINECLGLEDPAYPIRAGDTVRFTIGCCGGTTVEEQQHFETLNGPPWITLDGAALPIYVTGMYWTEIGSWYTNEGRYEWTATPGAHTVSGNWGTGGHSYTCPFNVE